MGKTNGKLARRVFIAGVGCTPFRRVMDDADEQGITESELFSWATLDALEDAGINPKQVEAYSHGQVFNTHATEEVTPAAPMNRWIGMHGKPGFHHDEGCATGYLGLNMAAQAVASGSYDIVVCGGVELTMSGPVTGKPAYMRRRLTPIEIGTWNGEIPDRCYTKWFSTNMAMDNICSQYRLNYGLSAEDIDETLIHIYMNGRYNSMGNELAFNHGDPMDTVRMLGMSSIEEWLHSDIYNPKVSEYVRKAFTEFHAEGAAAAVVVSEEVARDLKNKPIEILAGTASTAEISTPNIETFLTRRCVNEIYDITGLSGKDIDLLMANDFRIPMTMVAAEETGYIPRGECWRYFIDGRTRYDGDKPINTNGGRACFGHAYAASGLADIYEAVKQMRGQAFHQIKTPPKTVFVRGFGGGQNATATILHI